MERRLRPRAVDLPYGWAASIVLVWRAAAYLSPSPFIAIVDNWRLPMALLGLLFLGCGSYARYRRTDEAAAAFFVYCVGGGVHWGGAVGVGHDLDIALLCVYLSLSALGEGALLHFALTYPTPVSWRRGWLPLAYGPAAVCALAIPAALVLPQPAVEVVAAGMLIAANALSVIAVFTLIARFFRSSTDVRRASRLTGVIALGVVSSIVGQVGSSGLLLGPPEAWNMLFGVLPVTLAVAITLKPRPSGRG